MAKYLSGRVKTTPQSQLPEDRNRYLSVGDAEPNLGDPLVGPSSIGAKPVPNGQQYIIVSVPSSNSSSVGERYWIPNQGGTIPGAISIFDEGNLVGGLSRTTQLNIVGAAITALQPDGTFVGIPVTTNGDIGISTNIIKNIDPTGISTGYIVINSFVSTGTTVTSIGVNEVGISLTTTNSTSLTGQSFTFNPDYNPTVDITVFSPGNNKEILFNNNNEFSTSTKLTFDTSNGLLTTGDRITVGAGGTVITTTSGGLVGIGTTNPTQELHIQGDLRLTGTIYDYLNQPGSSEQILVKNNFGGVLWVNQGTVRAGAGGTYRNIQFHNSAGLVDGASNFVFDEVNSRIGIGSTQPNVFLDVLGISRFKGGTTIDNLNVTGVTTTSTLAVSGTTTTRNLQVTGVTTIGFVTGTSAYLQSQYQLEYLHQFYKLDLNIH